jgi:hypothetical protein
MKVKAPFQGQDEPAGQGFDGKRFYVRMEFVLRAYLPFHDLKGQPRLWKRPFVWRGPVRKIYERAA